MKTQLNIQTAAPKMIAQYLNYLLEVANNIDKNSDDDQVWRKLYDVVFSDEISKVIYKRFPEFEPYIPDTTYMEDVTTFIYEFVVYVNDCEIEAEFPSFEQWAAQN